MFGRICPSVVMNLLVGDAERKSWGLGDGFLHWLRIRLFCHNQDVVCIGSSVMSLSPKAIYDWYRNTLRNPKYRWWIILGTLAYLVSPLDISPDFFPIAGQIDDVLIVTLLVSELSQMALEFFKARQDNLQKENTTDTKTAPTVDIPSVSVD